MQGGEARDNYEVHSINKRTDLGKFMINDVSKDSPSARKKNIITFICSSSRKKKIMNITYLVLFQFNNNLTEYTL